MAFGGHPFWILNLVAYLSSFGPNSPSDIDGDPINSIDLDLEYDYVIVGGGSAGSALASRLSEDPDVSVLLLEAGGQENQLSTIPGLVGYLQLSPLDWMYKSEPSSTSCLAMIDNRCNLPRGKVIGGSSTINYMIYVRGNRNDYNNWESMGNNGWSFSDVLKYFKASEDNTNPFIGEDSDYHNIGGPLTVGEAAWRTQLANAFIEAADELGYPIGDCNGFQQTGFMIAQGTVRDGTRCSNARAFLRPARNRPNLHIALNSHVTKILINTKLMRTYGVTYDRDDEVGLNVFARREVILSAGAIGSPHLLMLSGIGPAEHLKFHDIPVIVDLPVGDNLQDHIGTGPIFTVEEAVSLQTNKLSTLYAMTQFALSGTGPLTTLGGVEGLGFVNTKFANQSVDWPDIEYQFVSGSHGSDDGVFFHEILGLKKRYWDDFYSHLHGKDHFTIIAKLLRPQSRGYIRLTTSDPHQYPKIVTNYLDKEMDIRVLIEGVKIAVRLGKTDAFEKFGAKLFSVPMPGCEYAPFNSDSYWECFARHLTFTIYHYSGTAKMGPYWDKESVVDSELRVYGVGGLRVVDASIFPTIPSGNTNAPVTMVAEKAAHMIRKHYSSPDAVPITPLKRHYVKKNNFDQDEVEDKITNKVHEL